jgi:hypothetical protein
MEIPRLAGPGWHTAAVSRTPFNTQKDGKTQTVMTKGKDAQGTSINNVSVYDRW